MNTSGSHFGTTATNSDGVSNLLPLLATFRSAGALRQGEEQHGEGEELGDFWAGRVLWLLNTTTGCSAQLLTYHWVGARAPRHRATGMSRRWLIGASPLKEIHVFRLPAFHAKMEPGMPGGRNNGQERGGELTLET